MKTLALASLLWFYGMGFGYLNGWTTTIPTEPAAEALNITGPCDGCQTANYALQTTPGAWPSCAVVTTSLSPPFPQDEDGFCVYWEDLEGAPGPPDGPECVKAQPCTWTYFLHFDFSACENPPQTLVWSRWESWSSTQLPPRTVIVGSDHKVVFEIRETVPCISGLRLEWSIDQSPWKAAELWLMCTACDVQMPGE